MYKILVIISVVFLTSCDTKTSEDYHLEANKLEQQENYKEAIKLLNKAIEKDPNNIKALLDRAVDKSMLKQYNGAISDYTKVLAIDPKNCLALMNRGKNKNRLDKYKEAITDYNKVVQLKGGENLAITKVENSFVDNGFEFDVAIEEVKFERGIAYYNSNNLKAAFDDFNFSIQQNYSLSDCYYWRGLIYINYKMYNEGCSDFRKASELGDPDAPSLIEEYCK
jgi:tetratricopeptide (TPR) repeat protein